MKRRTLKNMPYNIYISITDQDNNELFLTKNHFNEYILTKFHNSDNLIKFNSKETAYKWINHNMSYFQYILNKFQSYTIEPKQVL
jgi:hypothetical protein